MHIFGAMARKGNHGSSTVLLTAECHGSIQDNTQRLHETSYYPNSTSGPLPASQRLLPALGLSNKPRFSVSGRCQYIFDREMDISFEYCIKKSPFVFFNNNKRSQHSNSIPVGEERYKSWPSFHYRNNCSSSFDSTFERLSIRQIFSPANNSCPQSSASSSTILPFRSPFIFHTISEHGNADLEDHYLDAQAQRIPKSKLDAFWTGLTTVANAVKSIHKSWSPNIPNLAAPLQIIGAFGLKCVSSDGLSGFTGLPSNRNVGLETELSPSSRTGTLITSGNAPPCHDRLSDIGPTLLHSNGFEGKEEGQLGDLDADTRKLILVEKLMEEFWKVFDKELNSMAAGPEVASSKNTPAAMSTHASQDPTSHGSKRGGKVAATDNPDEDDEGDFPRKRQRSQAGSETLDPEIGFACPYRKHNPRKYNVRDWRICALVGHNTVARIKAHLYRYHLIYNCERCNALFETMEDLHAHHVATIACELVQLESPPDGVTPRMKEKLRTKKKAFPGQTETDRWRDVYQILFPATSTVPSPYFEPIQEDENRPRDFSPGSSELARYEEYLRAELPRRVREAIIGIVTTELQPIESRLIEQLENVILETQAAVFSEYRTAMLNPENITEGHALTSTLTSTSTSTSDQRRTEREETRHHSLHDLEFSDSGYGSNLTLPPLWGENQLTDGNGLLLDPLSRGLDLSKGDSHLAIPSSIRSQPESENKEPAAADSASSGTISAEIRV